MVQTELMQEPEETLTALIRLPGRIFLKVDRPTVKVSMAAVVNLSFVGAYIRGASDGWMMGSHSATWIWFSCKTRACSKSVWRPAGFCSVQLRGDSRVTVATVYSRTQSNVGKDCDSTPESLLVFCSGISKLTCRVVSFVALESFLMPNCSFIPDSAPINESGVLSVHLQSGTHDGNPRSFHSLSSISS